MPYFRHCNSILLSVFFCFCGLGLGTCSTYNSGMCVLVLWEVSRLTAWTGDRLVARRLLTQDDTQRRRGRTSMPPSGIWSNAPSVGTLESSTHSRPRCYFDRPCVASRNMNINKNTKLMPMFCRNLHLSSRSTSTVTPWNEKRYRSSVLSVCFPFFGGWRLFSMLNSKNHWNTRELLLKD